MKRVIIIESQSGDWEILYIDGKEITQNHSIGEGNKLYMLKKAEEYNFTIDDVIIYTAKDEDEDDLRYNGNFPYSYSDLKGVYI